MRQYKVNQIAARLARTTACGGRQVAAYEAYMRKAGFSQGDMNDINEHRMRARWRLGRCWRMSA